jgi:anti-sigma regulatory factor (Ser/Thr protein kinase)
VSATEARFHHEAVFYAGDDEFVEANSAFLRTGLEADEPTLVMVGGRKIELLREALGADAGRITFADMEVVGSNPARIIPAWRAFADEHGASGRRLRGIGEPIWAGRGPAELVECQRHESLLNLAFADCDGFILACPYDTSALGDDVIEEARRSHPCLVAGGHDHESSEYTGLAAAAAPFDAPLPEPAAAHELAFGRGDLTRVRRFVSQHGAAALDGRTTDLVMAANEAASNSLRHGGGEGIVRIWSEDGAVVCEVRDRGRIEEPLAGRERPAGLQVGGHGLWLMNQLCDLVQVRAFEQGGAVRMHMRAPAGASQRAGSDQ